MPTAELFRSWVDLQSRRGSIISNVAAPERPVMDKETTAIDLSPSKAALASAFPILTPGYLPEEVCSQASMSHWSDRALC